jgi:hypothetical protein
MVVAKPRWTTSSYLLYAGGLIVLVAALGALGYLSSRYGAAAYAGWAALILVVFTGIGLAFKREGRWIAAGIFGFGSLIAWAAFVAALYAWFGWLHSVSPSSPFAGFSVARLSFELLVLAAVFDDMRRFRFPLMASVGVFVAWFFVTDLISGGGNWSAVVTLFIGLVYLFAGMSVDRGPRSPYGFWWHLWAGFLIGGALLYWWHSSEADWALLATASVVFILLSGITWRSSWAVLGVIGFLAAATHWTIEWVATGIFNLTTDRNWVPLVVFAVVGFFFVLLGLYLDWRRRRREPAMPLPAV